MENEKISNIEFQMQDAENFYCILLKKINSCVNKKEYTEWSGEKFYCGLKCQCENKQTGKKGKNEKSINKKCQYKGKNEKKCEGKKIKEYLDEVVPDWKLMNPNRLYKHIQNMLENAEEIRRFEIGLTWRRVINFIPLIIIFSTAFGGAFLKFQDGGTDFLSVNNQEKTILILIAFVNIFLCFLLYRMNLESHNWQSNWEYHVDYLQNILGLQLMRTCLRSQGGYLTISKTSNIINGFLIWIWGGVIIGLVISFFISIFNFKLDINGTLFWILIFELVLTGIFFIFSFHFFTSKRRFFETRKVMSGEKFYIRYLEDFDLKNKTEKYLDVEHFVKFMIKFIFYLIIFTFCVGLTIFGAIWLLSEDPESLIIKLFLAPIILIASMFLYFSLKHIIPIFKIKKKQGKIFEDLLKVNIIVVYATLILNISSSWFDEKFFNNSIDRFIQTIAIDINNSKHIRGYAEETFLSHIILEFILLEFFIVIVSYVIFASMLWKQMFNSLKLKKLKEKVAKEK